MDPIRNPYAPGAGTPPPELAGRADIIDAARIAMLRTASGRPTQSQILVGLRGVGKTVLLSRIREICEAEKYRAIPIEATDGKSLPDLIIPAIRQTLFSLDAISKTKNKLKQAFRVLKSFISTFKVSYGDFELTIDPERGVADSGDLEVDLPSLMRHFGEAAKDAGVVVVFLIDEMQYLKEKEFSAFISAMHLVNQYSLPIILVGAGLPQILALAGNAKSYAERLFTYPSIGALSEADAERALLVPANQEGVRFEPEAVRRIIGVTKRYPYFLQQWAHDAWNIASGDVIGLQDVETANTVSIDKLDRSFFKVRFDRCTPAEKRYMRALAESGSGPMRSGNIAELLGMKVTSVAPIRGSLIRKGMVYSPAHGETEFTVPLFDEYMKRVMPDVNWPNPN